MKLGLVKREFLSTVAFVVIFIAFASLDVPFGLMVKPANQLEETIISQSPRLVVWSEHIRFHAGGSFKSE